MAPKAFPPLDHRIITAIKGKLATLNLFSALNIQFKHLKMEGRRIKFSMLQPLYYLHNALRSWRDYLRITKLVYSQRILFCFSGSDKELRLPVQGQRGT